MLKRMLNDVKAGRLQPRLNFDNAVSRAIDDLEEARKHKKNLDEAHEDMYGRGYPRPHISSNNQNNLIHFSYKRSVFSWINFL
jgi:hypothetical protein